MSSFQAHPDQGLLLDHFDGELPTRRSRQVERHLAACWQCRSEIEELRATAADCVRYRNQVLGAYLPAPARWPDLTSGFARVDAEFATESWLSWLSEPRVRRWAAGFAAGAVAIAGLLYKLRDTPQVEAAVLLDRAVAIAKSRPPAKRQIRVRTRSRSFSVAPPAVRALFDAAKYDLDDPLSARSYQRWRDSLRAKTDEVAVTPETYHIRTATAEGALAAASLTLRAADLRPTEGRFEFRNSEWVELTEVPEASTRDDGLSVETNVEAPKRRAVPSRPEAAMSEGPASISDELQVIAALHEIGADLGDPLEVTRSAERVVVSGVGVSPERQSEIRRALDAISRVAIRFGEPPAAPEAREAPGAPAAGARPGSMPPQLEQKLGGRAEFARIGAQILEWNEAAMARAYALRALAQRFPAEATRVMPGSDHAVLARMARAHLDAMAVRASDIQRALAPVLGGNPSPVAPLSGSATWQSVAEDVFQAGRRVEMLLSGLLGVAQDSARPERVTSDLAAAIGRLRAALDQCQRLVSE